MESADATSRTEFQELAGQRQERRIRWERRSDLVTWNRKSREMIEACAICGCKVHRAGEYAKPTVKGRSHATKHHYVAERFFGRSSNRPESRRKPTFDQCPWGLEGKTEIYCYECHEELLHNPVFLPEDILRFAELVRRNGLAEDKKTASREKLAGRIKLLHDVVESGLRRLLESER